MLSRKHSSALSLTTSVMISASLLGTMPSGSVTAGAGAQIMPAVLQEAATAAQAAGWTPASASAPRPIATPAASATPFPATPPSVEMTDAEAQKLDHYFQKYSKQITIDQQVADIFGLAKPGDSFLLRQFSGNDTGDHVHMHYFGRGVADPNKIIFMYLDKKTLTSHGYLTDGNFNYVAAYTWDGQIQKLSAAEGEVGLAGELKWWASTMDKVPDLP